MAIMKVKEIKERTTEQLIFSLCALQMNETKAGRESEKRIVKELANRGVINHEEMEKIYKKYYMW